MKVVSIRATDRVADLFESFELVEHPKRKYSEAELVELLDGADSAFIHAENQFTESVLSQLPSLKVIGKPGSGVDNIDLDAATALGIPVLHTPGMNAAAVAEYNVGLAIALLRHLPAARDHLRDGGWRSEDWEGTEIRGKTVGIVGLGQTGFETARRFDAFDVDLLTADPYITADRAANAGADLVDLDVLLSDSDIVLLHVRLTPETEGLIGAAELDRMKDSAVLVNTARGQLVDKTQLLEHLTAGSIAGAALDVFHEEPPEPDDPLVSHPSVLATPHLAGATTETRENVLRTTAENVVTVLRGGTVDDRFVANPGVFDR